MFRTPYIRAWKWLLAHFVITASLSYYVTFLFAAFEVVTPEHVLMTTTFGLKHFGSKILWQGMALGIDKGVMIFFCNMTVALLILSIIGWVRLLNPYSANRRFILLRKRLQRDRTARHLRRIPYFARIESEQLRISTFLLLCVPFIVVVILGLIAGTLLGSVHAMTNSAATAFAYIIPHGIPEIAAILLTCSIPLAMWINIQSVLYTTTAEKAFRRIGRMATSQELQKSLIMIINLFLIAGLVEAHLTHKVVSLITSG